MSEQSIRVAEQASACAQPNAAVKVELGEQVSLIEGCKKVIHDIEKRSENIMQAVCDAEYKGSLPAPHTLAELKQSLDRNEYSTYSEFYRSLEHVWNNVQLYFPEHTSLHKAATDMKQLSLKLVSEISGQSASQLQAHAESAVQPACTSTGTMHTSVQDPPSYAHMSAFGGSADLLAQSVFMSMFPANSFNFSNPEASLFSLLMSQPDMNMYPSAQVSTTPASMGENALNIAHGAAYDAGLINQYFNTVSMMFPAAMQPAADVAAPVLPRPVHQPHPKFDPNDLGPAPEGKNPLLDPEPSQHVHLDMVGITATVHFRCQFNIDALRNYADRNEKKFVPSSDQKKSVENSVNFRISVPGGVSAPQVAGVLFVNGICKVSFARSDLSQLFDEVQRHIFTIDTDAQKAGHRVIQDPRDEWVAEDDAESPAEWRRWCAINYCLIKKQFQVGFKVMYVAALSLLSPLEKQGFIYDLRPAQSSGSGLFFRLRLRGKTDALEGEISATIYHSGMVQVNGSKGCTEEHLQIACNGFCQFLQRNRQSIEPPSDEYADGNKRKKRAIASSPSTLHNS